MSASIKESVEIIGVNSKLTTDEIKDVKSLLEKASRSSNYKIDSDFKKSLLNDIAILNEEINYRNNEQNLYKADTNHDIFSSLRFLLSTYVAQQKALAESIAKEMEARSKSISEIKKAVQDMMTDIFLRLDGGPEDKAILSSTSLNQIEGLISKYQKINPSITMKDVLGVNARGASLQRAQVDKIQASTDAWVDREKIAIDTLKEKAKAAMKKVTHGEEEIKSLRQFETNFASNL